MTTSTKDLRVLIERGRTASGQLRGSARGEVVEVIERLHAEGTSYRETAEALGVNFQTLMSWRAQQRSVALVPVRVSAAAPPRGLTVHGPRGLRIEGVSLDDIAMLWARLSP